MLSQLNKIRTGIDFKSLCETYYRNRYQLMNIESQIVNGPCVLEVVTYCTVIMQSKLVYPVLVLC